MFIYSSGASKGSLFNLWLIIKINTVLLLLVIMNTGDRLGAEGYQSTSHCAGSFLTSDDNWSYSPYTGAGLIVAQASIVVKLGAIPGHM